MSKYKLQKPRANAAGRKVVPESESTESKKITKSQKPRAKSQEISSAHSSLTHGSSGHPIVGRATLVADFTFRAANYRMPLNPNVRPLIQRMVDIRPLQEADSIIAMTGLLHRAYARLGEMGLNYTAVDQTPEVTAKRISGGQCFVAVEQSLIIGTIVVQPTYAESNCKHFTKAGVAATHQFAVEPSWHGRGIGRALLQRAEQWSFQQGFTELAIDTAEEATHLVELYARLGYREVGKVQWPSKKYRSVVLSKHLGAKA